MGSGFLAKLRFGGGPRHVKTATLSTNTLLGVELDWGDGLEGDGRKRKPTPTSNRILQSGQNCG